MSESVVRAFAPATVANLGPGFDVLGLAVQSIGDTVSVSRSKVPGVRVLEITGDDGVLPKDPAKNTAAVAARAVLDVAGIASGLEIRIEKGLPLCSGLGSSAASAAAAAFATNALLGSPLRKVELIAPCVEAEAVVSGRHADNVAPALLGGLVLVRDVDPVDVIRLPVPEGLTIVLVTPSCALPTKEAREALPADVEMSLMVTHSAQLAALVSACYANDLSLLSRSLFDPVVTPARLPLIPGASRSIDAALGAGALGASISGAGPSIFAMCRSARSAARVAHVMSEAFLDAGLESSVHISPADCPGARRV